MGVVGSRVDESPALYVKDQSRFSISSLVITNARRRVVLSITSTANPTTRLSAKKAPGDDTPISYIQDPESTNYSFIPSLDLEDELDFSFRFIARQPQTTSTLPPPPAVTASNDTVISGLTFAYASNTKELDTLVTREFHADPNLHKNSNVQLIGDFSTNGSPSVEFDWNWKWRPPKSGEDKGGGWRNTCTFLEYDSRAHRLNTLASFAFWVNNDIQRLQTPLATPRIELVVPVHRQRDASSQSYNSAVSDSEGPPDGPVAPSPHVQSSEFYPSGSASGSSQPVIDVSCQRPGEDMSAVEDGPVFRATMKSLEQKTGNMRVQIKKVLKKAEAAQQAQVECNQAMKAFLGALQEASASNASAFKPALDHYFTKIATRILQYENENSILVQKQVIEPLSRLYNVDIKQAESKKKDFEEESRDYYAYVSRYLGQRQDSLKEKKRAESDSKYQSKKRNFELKRFDYSSFMQDLHGGRKEQELLSRLTKYADRQAKSFLATAKDVETLTPQLDALVYEVKEADKEYSLQKTEREEKRRNLEKTSSASNDTDVFSNMSSNPSAPSVQAAQPGYNSDTEITQVDSITSYSALRTTNTLSPTNSVLHGSTNGAISASPGGSSIAPTPNKFKGIRDLEERDITTLTPEKSQIGQYRKEGLLWALSKPGSHIDPKGINKQAWHKFWIVLDQGKLSEYSNWKDKLDLHREPIDLRVASVRVARDAERRFCFEVITPQFKRVYQATTEEEMSNWINAINNALQSAVEGRSTNSIPQTLRNDTTGREYGSVLTGKSLSQSGSHSLPHRSDSTSLTRRITVGARPSYIRTTSNSFGDNPTKLLDQIRNNDHGNAFCADCASTSRVEWVSLNLGIILCIECGGIHRSLGTHVSKVRSLTLDVHSFTNDIVELLLLVGNRISNMVWEARLDQKIKPEAYSTRDQRLKFITAKYVERAYIEPAGGQYTTADDKLLTSVKRHDIQGVLQGIAQRANTNAHDRSRNTHVVFLALAAADPALPVGTATTSGGNAATKAFPIAEILVQNGAEIPIEPAPIPLSTAAQLYVEQRTAKATTIVGSNDTLGPLPNVSGKGVMTSETTTTMSRLQKRGSAGARFAGKVTGLGER